MGTTDITATDQAPLDGLDAVGLPVRSRISVAMARAAYAVRRAVGSRHSLPVEATIIVLTYIVYDAARGLASGGASRAIADARDVAHAEAHLGIFIEPGLQHALEHVPGLMGLFGFGYATFHLGVTLCVLVWVYVRRRSAYARFRTALLAATGFALIGFVAFPAAPPRLAGVGVSDTLHLGHTTAASGVLRILYNPYAAMPSLHFAFAALVGGALVCLARYRAVRVLGLIYPVFVAFEVMATGNHFLLDLVGGAAAALLAVGVAIRIAPTGPDRRLGPAFAAIGDHVREAAGRRPAAHGSGAVEPDEQHRTHVE